MAATGGFTRTSVKPGLPRLILGWVLSVLLAFVFFAVSGAKLLSVPAFVQEFHHIGLGQWFRYLTGALEVIGAVGILVPKFSRWAALLLAVVMIGAIVAHLTVLHSSPALPTALLILAALTAWLRR
jgi:uncharacterized membrane protein YphA (DoxX/SURF4 family)